MDKHRDLSLHAFSSQGCEHCFGESREENNHNNSLAGVTNVIKDIALIPYLEGKMDYKMVGNKYHKNTTVVVHT